MAPTQSARATVIQGFFPAGPHGLGAPAASIAPAVQARAQLAQDRLARAHPHPLAQSNVAQRSKAQPQAIAAQRHGDGEAFKLPTSLPSWGAGSGQPLPLALRQKMESFFGASFADVRVHVGPQAASIGAHAFTQGSNLYFAPGMYDPGSARGQQLLGHELTHVVQQRAGRVRNPFGSGVAVVQDRGLEAEAERMGQRAALHRFSPPDKMAGSPALRHAFTAGIGPAAGHRAHPLQPALPAVQTKKPSMRARIRGKLAGGQNLTAREQRLAAQLGINVAAAAPVAAVAAPPAPAAPAIAAPAPAPAVAAPAPPAAAAPAPAAGGLNAAAAPFVPGGGLNAAAAPFVPGGGLNAAAAPFVPAAPPPPLPVHPPLPIAVAPIGYQVALNWHWGFDVWAAAAGVHWAGHNLGDQPHFNIQAPGGPMLHVYLGAGPPFFLIIDMAGNQLGAY